jgi:PIN domain nuclease of toxin-antitoxin system
VAEVVLDASAILALLRREPGFEQVAEVVGDARVSAVNLAEVGSFLIEAGQSHAEMRATLDSLRLAVVDFDEEQAIEAARLRPLTASIGLSLGDRACLALAGLRRLPAITTDRSWGTLKLGVDVTVVR